MPNKEQENFFDAIERQDILRVREMIEEGVNINALDPRGTALYRSVKLHNFELSKLLMENGADCNIVQLEFDQNSCLRSIYTPISLLYDEDKPDNDKLLQYLLEKRSRITKEMINQRIHYCEQLFHDTNNGMLFDYAASHLLRRNIWDILQNVSNYPAHTIVTAVLNVNAYFPNNETKTVTPDGGSPVVFFVFLIRSLFEELVLFNLEKSRRISSKEQYEHILYELLHQLEAYNLFLDIDRIPHNRKESFYPFITKQIIGKLKTMEINEEYTLPVYWAGHALCLNFVRQSTSIVIRVDNLNSAEKKWHEHYCTDDGALVMIPAFIGEIPLEELDDNKDYFHSLLECITVIQKREDGIQIIYKNEKLTPLDKSRAKGMAKKLDKSSKGFNYFIQQAEDNCFIKCHEPGLIIRSNYSDIPDIIDNIMMDYALELKKLKVPNMVQKGKDCERTYLDYWNKETTLMQISGKCVFSTYFPCK